jgi:hypothetical protein
MTDGPARSVGHFVFVVAARMPGREQTEGLGFKKRAIKTLPALRAISA